jgi:hypothetical protein
VLFPGLFGFTISCERDSGKTLWWKWSSLGQDHVVLESCAFRHQRFHDDAMTDKLRFAPSHSTTTLQQTNMSATQTAPVALPRVAITYCTQCRWLLRAAYFGQELLSTFGTQIGEIALIPATGGLFTVELVRFAS